MGIAHPIVGRISMMANDTLSSVTSTLDRLLAEGRPVSDSNIEEQRRDLARRRDALLREIHRNAEVALINPAIAAEQTKRQAEINQIDDEVAAINRAICATKGKIPW
jgi:hypothetical protein